ncbi:hypothetical protein DMA11_23535 [Marinilabiliaceae bacterium JC017]|nr:hypothetical protein DMA11_23535 [Marinilabiliaceae bacterium JC017]
MGYLLIKPHNNKKSSAKAQASAELLTLKPEMKKAVSYYLSLLSGDIDFMFLHLTLFYSRVFKV